MGVSLVHYIDSLCRRIDVPSSSLQPCDVTLTEADLASEHLTLLQGRYGNGTMARPAPYILTWILLNKINDI